MSTTENTHTNVTTEPREGTVTCDRGARPAQLRALRKMRLVGRLVRTEMGKTMRANPTRGEVKAARARINAQISEAVTDDELAALNATLTKIADAFGGRDALPFFDQRPFGRGHGRRPGRRWAPSASRRHRPDQSRIA